jgi:hypothetical protein
MVRRRFHDDRQSEIENARIGNRLFRAFHGTSAKSKTPAAILAVAGAV